MLPQVPSRVELPAGGRRQLSGRGVSNARITRRNHTPPTGGLVGRDDLLVLGDVVNAAWTTHRGPCTLASALSSCPTYLWPGLAISLLNGPLRASPRSTGPALGGITPATSWGRRWRSPSPGSTPALTSTSLAAWSSQLAVKLLAAISYMSNRANNGAYACIGALPAEDLTGTGRR